MITRFFERIFGTRSERTIKRELLPAARAVREREAACVAMSNDELRGETRLFKQRLAEGESLDDLLPEAFAVVCEAAKRVVGMRPFDCQVLGGVWLHRGNIAEMLTGEGKTLVATMPVYLNALTGKGVHVVTVNDYLARRDREWMGPIYEFLGLTVGLIQHDMDAAERRVGYRADITYGTNNEFGFDYLRDNMAKRPEHRVQRELNFAIIDEIDSILIDEARTPLIISGRPERSTDLYLKVDEAVRALIKKQRSLERNPVMKTEGEEPEPLKMYEVEEKGKHCVLSDEGMEFIEAQLGMGDLFMGDQIQVVHMIEQSLRAHHFYRRDDEYLVRNGQVVIVDQFTGRAMEGRRWSDGLHQAVEAKEGVPIQFESQTIASITYQNLFRLYNKLAGMTGTAMTEAEEFQGIYGLDVIEIPPNLPLIREDRNDLVYATEPGKFRQVVNEIVRLHEEGRPVLVGTVSIEKSEAVATELESRDIKGFEVLNAKHHDKEASIVANAGKRGAITIATNMAGRGTDIKLGEGVRELGGLAIIGTERHESRRIDNQLRGRCGRQGDPGTTQFYLSLEDEVARLFGGPRVKRLLNMFGAEDQMDEEPLSQGMVSRTIARAQKQVEELNLDARKHLLKYDNDMNLQRQVIYAMRREVLEDKDVSGRIEEMFRSLVAGAVEEYASDDVMPEDWDLEGLALRLRQMFGFEPDIAGPEDGEPQPLVDSLMDQVLSEYRRREAVIAEEIREDFQEQIGGDDAGIDFARLARRTVHNYEKMALLSSVDERWIDHLCAMDYLRESVRLRAYGQRDPLIEFNREAYEMFQSLLRGIDEDVAQVLFRVTDPEVRRTRRDQMMQGTLTRESDPFAQLSDYHFVGADKQQDNSFASYDTSRFVLAGQSREAEEAADARPGEQQPQRPKPKPVRAAKEPKPNDPCPCGSGKKYKKCCGAVVSR